MAFNSVRSDLHQPQLSRVVTAAGSQVVLCNGTNDPIAANPNGVNHLPARILVLPVAAGGSVVWLDAVGTSNTLVIEAGAAATPVVPFELPCTARSIEAGTTSGFKFVVAWNVEP